MLTFYFLELLQNNALFLVKKEQHRGVARRRTRVRGTPRDRDER